MQGPRGRAPSGPALLLSTPLLRTPTQASTPTPRPVRPSYESRQPSDDAEPAPDCQATPGPRGELRCAAGRGREGGAPEGTMRSPPRGSLRPGVPVPLGPEAAPPGPSLLQRPPVAPRPGPQPNSRATRRHGHAVKGAGRPNESDVPSKWLRGASRPEASSCSFRTTPVPQSLATSSRAEPRAFTPLAARFLSARGRRSHAPLGGRLAPVDPRFRRRHGCEAL